MTKSTTKGLTLDDVERLSYGKRSASRKGSRRIPHRLNNAERALFERAKSHGQLWSLSALNPALVNTYYNFCCATGRIFISMIRLPDGSFELLLREPEIALQDTDSLKFQAQSAAIHKAITDSLHTLKLPKHHLSQWNLSYKDAQSISKAIRIVAVESMHIS